MTKKKEVKKMEKLPKGYKWYDGRTITIEQELKKRGVDTGKEDNPKLYKLWTETEDMGIYNLPLRDFSRAFCETHSKGVVPQFMAREGFFERRWHYIEDARVYRFKDKFMQLMVEHNKNDIGFRPLPNNNMWIEVPLQFGKIKIAGIHLVRVFVNDNDEYASQVYPDELVPVGYDQEAISIFVTGLDGDISFYNYFLLEKIGKYDKLKPVSKYVCPYCGSPLKKFEDKNWFYCELESCVETSQKGKMVMYDMDDYKTKNTFKVMKMNDIWRIEDKIRLFVSNFLDYIEEPEVKIITSISSTDLAKRNLKRARKGKPPLPPIRIITVSGEIKRYINLIGERCRTLEIARNETWVDGHFFRFWDRNKWTRLYAWIKGCKTDEEIREKLKKLVRKDDKGHPLPQTQQYRWDSHHKLIKVHKLAFVKWKGMGEPVQRIKVVDVE